MCIENLLYNVYLNCDDCGCDILYIFIFYFDCAFRGYTEGIQENIRYRRGRKSIFGAVY